MKAIFRKTEEEFNGLYQVYYHDLVNFAYSYLMDSDEAEDLVQNLFVHFWENLDHLELRDSLKSYLYSAVKNRCLNKLKSIQVYDRHKVLYTEAKLNLIFGSEELQKMDMEEELSQALSKLPAQVRQIIELKYFQGKKISEIGQELNISENSVKTQLQRGRQKLKQDLDPKLFLFFLIGM
ncbi:RNA polymerase sigma factor [Algoriphagus resistens]|uniref:RNA polymerase sigma factor n=1 Tax=Algoriphagus resistens TaxID=1750590 RepID=UPI000716B9CF|nr:RNA polymerase sigma-70 factor [Algoriphagus resistens]